MMLSLLLIAGTLLPSSSAPDDVFQFRKALLKSIDKANAAEGVPAAEGLGKLGSKAAGRELQGAFKKLSKRLARDTGEDKEETAALEAIGVAVTKAMSVLPAAQAVPALEKALEEESIALRRGAALGLGGIRTKESIDLLVEHVKTETNVLLTAAILEKLMEERALCSSYVETMTQGLGAEAWPVVLAAARGLAETREPKVVPLLIGRLEGAMGKVKSEINALLRSLTKVDKKGDFATWKAWFEENREAVLAGTYEPRPGEGADKAQAGGTTFYGRPVTSTQIIFVLDASLSMKRPAAWVPPPWMRENAVASGGGAFDPLAKLGKLPENPTKIEVAKYELKKVLLTLPEKTKFNIVFFNRVVELYRKDAMATLTESERDAVFAWIDAVDLKGQTDVYSAVKESFRLSGAFGDGTGLFECDTIYVLSDGLPITKSIKNVETTDDPEKILSDISTWNTSLKLTINTIGIHATGGGNANRKNARGGKGAKFLGSMAEQNDGVYAEPGQKEKPKEEEKKNPKKNPKKKPDAQP